MFRYPSNVTFLYYKDLSYGRYVMETIFDLPLVMDQGFAYIYQINTTSFVGVVEWNEAFNFTGNTLLSFNTTSLDKEYTRIQQYEVIDLTDIKHFSNIPLDSFFFNDKEGHRFEIQQFILQEHKTTFHI